MGVLVLELAILGLLEEQELHGYELRKRLSETLGFLASVSFGSLYPALARLEASGALVALSPSTSGQGPSAFETAASRGGGEALRRIPMTGSLAGERAAFRTPRTTTRARSPHVGATRSPRQRRVYAITEVGRAMFRRLLTGDQGGGEADDDRCFALRLAFARHLAPEARLRLLERRRAVLTQRQARSAPDPADPGDTWRTALAEHRAASLDSDIEWLDRLIEAERARVAAAPATTPDDPSPRKVPSL